MTSGSYKPQCCPYKVLNKSAFGSNKKKAEVHGVMAEPIHSLSCASKFCNFF